MRKINFLISIIMISVGFSSSYAEPEKNFIPNISKLEGERREAVTNRYIYGLQLEKRQRLIDPVIVADKIGISSGMKILDLGAGIGNFTFAFADKLNNTGIVYASDIEPKMIDFMNEVIARKQYKNVEPILVTSKASDPFYQNNKFDLIFLSDVYFFIVDKKEFFSDLHDSLNPDGRIIIIQPRLFSNFDTLINEKTLLQVMNIIVSHDKQSPIYSRLNDKTKELMRQYHPDKKSDWRNLINALTADFNDILVSRTFFSDLMNFYPKKLKMSPSLFLTGLTSSTGYFQAARWLALNLEEQEVFENEKLVLDDYQLESLKRLNKILLISIFDLKEEQDTIYCTSDKSIKRVMAQSGYQFSKEYDFLPKFYVLEFNK